MGEVFLARRAGCEGLVVIKRIHPSLLMEEALRGHFLQEARAAARLDDPTIVRIVELGEVDGQWFLAMEFVEGVTLETLLFEGPLPLGAACRIGLEAAIALGVAHGAKDAWGRSMPVVHRDVSPSNLLVSTQGAVKLIDFGVASLAGQHVPGSGGRLAYAAPEQLAHGVSGPTGDQYSLGIVLWECLAHRAAFEGEDAEVIRLVTEMGVPPLPHSVPSGLREVVATMTALAPGDRFGDMAEARAALTAQARRLRLDVSEALLGALVQRLKPGSPKQRP